MLLYGSRWYSLLLEAGAQVVTVDMFERLHCNERVRVLLR